jgi:predicted nucleic acid-binding protein
MVNPIVLDASAWLAVILTEEGSDPIEAALIRHTLLAPELIRYETANGVIRARQSGRLTLRQQAVGELLELIRIFPIQMVPIDVFWKGTVRLVQRYHLTFYDATYLSTALAFKVPLLTRDGKIRAVMRQEGVPDLPAADGA